jgi:hypothetical protein
MGNEEEKPLRIQRFQFGPWLFNVNGGQAILAERPRDARPLSVELWVSFYGLDTPDDEVSLFWAHHLDRDYAMTTDLDEPLLVATLRNNEGEELPLLIDGTHRLHRAHVEHRARLPAYVLTVDESLAIREDGLIGPSVYRPSQRQQQLPNDHQESSNGGS